MDNGQYDYEEYYKELEKKSSEFFNEYLGLTELIKQYNNMKKSWENSDNIKEIINYICKKPIYNITPSIEQSKKIVEDFYKSIGLGEEFKDILNGKDGLEVNIGSDKEGHEIWYSYVQVPYDNDEYFINIRNHHSIENIFTIAHEFMHVMTLTEKKYNQATFTLREVPSFLIETLLYDYLIENKEKYNFSKEDLIHDIYINRFIRFSSYIDDNNRCFRLDYFIALLISNEFNKYTKQEKTIKLLKFLKNLKQDNIIDAINSLDIKLKGEKTNKINYINNLLNDYIHLYKEINNLETTLKKNI